MKKSTKITIILSAVLMVSGAIMSFGSAASMRFDLGRLDNAVLEKNTVLITEAFSEITVEAPGLDVYFVKSEDGTCKVEFNCEEGIGASASVSGGVLGIATADDRAFNRRFGIRFKSPYVTVALPGTVYDRIYTDTVSGDIYIPYGFTFTDAELVSSSGDINIGVAGRNIGGASIKSGDMRNAVVEANNVIVNTISGEIELNGVIAKGELRLESASGDIDLEGCDASALFIKTKSGEVSGDLLSGKDFAVNTVSGEVEIPRNSTGGKCEVTTVSGDIEFEISVIRDSERDGDRFDRDDRYDDWDDRYDDDWDDRYDDDWDDRYDDDRFDWDD